MILCEQLKAQSISSKSNQYVCKGLWFKTSKCRSYARFKLLRRYIRCRRNTFIRASRLLIINGVHSLYRARPMNIWCDFINETYLVFIVETAPSSLEPFNGRNDFLLCIYLTFNSSSLYLHEVRFHEEANDK